MQDKTELNFIAIDFETATSQRASVCEIGICVVRNARVAETRSWLVRPKDNRYQYWNIQVHGIKPDHTEKAPDFPTVWKEIEQTYLKEINTLVAHNVAFDRSCLHHSADMYQLALPDLKWICSLQNAKKIYNFGCNSLDYLCNQLGIEKGRHHRAGDDAKMCALLYLRELEDSQTSHCNE